MNVNQASQFVDTNILIYAYDRNAGEKRTRARRLLTTLWNDGAGCLSIQVLQEFYVVVTQKIAKPLPSQMAVQIIEDLALWRVHQPNVADILNAIDIQQRHSLSFWDAMIVNSALALDCTILWSEDFNHGQFYQKMQVRNPFIEGE